MNEAEKIDRAGRRRSAEARLARSRSAREAAATAHASRMVGSGPKRVAAGAVEVALSRVEAKVLDAAGDILVARGGEGQGLAEQIQKFIEAHTGR